MYNSRLIVDIHILKQNIESILQSLPQGVQLIPVLKADAYGLGIRNIGIELEKFPEISTIAVAQVSEGVSLRQAGVTQDILVMAGTPSFNLDLVIEHDLTLAVGSVGLATQLSDAAKAVGKVAKLHIKIETGLHRYGFAVGSEIGEFVAEYKNHQDTLDIKGAFSHFADTSNPESTENQYQSFLSAVAQLESFGITIPMRHISASAAFEHSPQYMLDAVRIGRRLYMDHPTKPIGGVKELVTWYSYITKIQTRKQGDTLGYGGHYHLDRDATVATICVGYGDGLNQTLVAREAPVMINGQRCRLLGCCMDQSFVDVTGVSCQINDTVTFFHCNETQSPLPSQEVALIAGDDEGCGLTSALTGRVERVYQ